MLRRHVLVLIAVLGLMQVCLAQAAANGGDKAKEKAKTTVTRGDVVSVEDGRLVVALRAKKGEASSEQAFAIPGDAAVRLERKKATLADLQPGMAVTLRRDEAGAVTGVSASYPRLVGTFVRRAENAVVLSVKQGKGKDSVQEVSVPVTGDVTVRIGKTRGTLDDLKPGMHITVAQTGEPAKLLNAREPKAKKDGAAGAKKDGKVRKGQENQKDKEPSAAEDAEKGDASGGM